MARTKQTARPQKKTPPPIGGLRVKYAHAKARCKIRKLLWENQVALVNLLKECQQRATTLYKEFADADELPSTVADDSYLTVELEGKQALAEQLNEATSRVMARAMHLNTARGHRAACKTALQAHPDYAVTKAKKKARARSEAHVDALLAQDNAKAAGKTPAVLTLSASE
jgi:archaeosine-15-forming tRNA-guanine transglycosylase